MGKNMTANEAVKPQVRQRETRFDSTRPGERAQLQLVRKVEVDRSRDALLTDFGKTTLEDRYLLPGESYQDMFARVATAYADDADHAHCRSRHGGQAWNDRGVLPERDHYRYFEGKPCSGFNGRYPYRADLQLVPDRGVADR